MGSKPKEDKCLIIISISKLTISSIHIIRLLIEDSNTGVNRARAEAGETIRVGERVSEGGLNILMKIYIIVEWIPQDRLFDVEVQMTIICAMCMDIQRVISFSRLGDSGRKG